MLNIFSVSDTFATDITMFVILIAFTLIVTVGAIWIISATMYRDVKGNGPLTIFSIALVVGIIIRVLLAVFVKGNRAAYSAVLGSQSDLGHLMSNGTRDLYANGVSTYPISLYILYIFAKLGSALGFANESVGMQIVIKLPLIISDIITAILIYKLLSGFASKYTTATIAGLFMLTPVHFIASAIWPTDIVLVLPLILAAFYFMSLKKYFGMFAAYSAALLTSKQALYLYPVFAVFVVLAFIKACKQLRFSVSHDFKELWHDADKSAVIKMPVYFLLFLLISYIICLPLTIGAINAAFFKWIFIIYLKPLADISLYANNSISIYNIFGRNGVGFNTNMAVWFVIACAIIVTSLICFMYLGKKNRANLIAIAAFALATVYIYFIGFSTMDMLLVFPIMLLAFCLIKDKRLLTVFLIFSVAFVLNSAGVLTYLGEFNSNASTSVMNDKIFLSVINIMASIIALLAHLYMILVTLDISAGQRKTFEPIETKSFKANMKNWLAR